MRRNVIRDLGIEIEDLRRMYEVDGHTDVEIGAVLEVSDVSISYFRKKWGIATKRPLQGLTEEKLRELYQSHSDSKIGAMFGVTKVAIRACRRRFGIKAISKTERTPISAKAVERSRRTADKREKRATFSALSDEDFVQLCAKKSDGEIAKLYGLAKPTVGERRRRLCVLPMSKSERCVIRNAACPFKPRKTYKYERSLDNKAKDAARQLEKRRLHRLEHPAKETRTFTCKICKQPWETAEEGHFSKCSSCKDAERVAKRRRVCAYCNNLFQDISAKAGMKYCGPRCFSRAKATRNGLVPSDGFLEDLTRECTCCGKQYTPKKANQKYCGKACYKDVYAVKSIRTKVCPITGITFTDTSPRNNARFADAAVKLKIGRKIEAAKVVSTSVRLEDRRQERVRNQNGGRIDRIHTLRKYTATWWGRVSELIFAAFRPSAKDMIVSHGNRSPYDFDDPELGRIEVRGVGASAKETPLWRFSTYGVNLYCEHTFLIAYNREGSKVEHIWLIPSQAIGTSLTLQPGSPRYAKLQYERSELLEMANRMLTAFRALPEPKYSPVRRHKTESNEWLNDRTRFTHVAKFAWERGRYGELLYGKIYSMSRDMNLEVGQYAKYDFQDCDGTKINVKTSIPFQKADGSRRWTFVCSSSHAGHFCDVYSCLCLAVDGSLFREYRIPASAWGHSNTLYIYESRENWQEYLVKGIDDSTA